MAYIAPGDSQFVGPTQPASWFSFPSINMNDIGLSIKDSVGAAYTKVSANVSRIFASSTPPARQEQSPTTGLGFWGALGALSGFGPPPQGATTFSKSVSNTTDFLSSSMWKGIVILALVAVAVLFVYSFVLSKAGRLANA